MIVGEPSATSGFAPVNVRNGTRNPYRIFNLDTEPFGKFAFLMMPDGVCDEH